MQLNDSFQLGGSARHGAHHVFARLGPVNLGGTNPARHNGFVVGPRSLLPLSSGSPFTARKRRAFPNDRSAARRLDPLRPPIPDDRHRLWVNAAPRLAERCEPRPAARRPAASRCPAGRAATRTRTRAGTSPSSRRRRARRVSGCGARRRSDPPRASAAIRSREISRPNISESSPLVTGWNIATAINTPASSFVSCFASAGMSKATRTAGPKAGLVWRAKLSPALTSSIGRPRRSSLRSSSSRSRAQSRPTTRARISRVTGFGAANSTASTRAFHSRQRNSGGRSASSRSKSGSGLAFRAMVQSP